jgi:hypothetical protein
LYNTETEVLQLHTSSSQLYQRKGHVQNNNDTMTASDKIKETAKQELQNLKIATTEGVKSGAYVYPFRVRFTIRARKAL